MSESHTGGERMQRMLEEIKGRNLWDELMGMRDEQRKNQEGAVWLIKGKDIPFENSKMGNLRWYMHPRLKTPCINTLMIYVQEIEPNGRSARFHHPGNQVIYIMQGEGYTALDGQNHHWAKGDVVQLPLRVKGTTVQHFNTSKDTVARFVCCEPNTMDSVGVDRGCGFEMLESATSFKKA